MVVYVYYCTYVQGIHVDEYVQYMYMYMIVYVLILVIFRHQDYSYWTRTVPNMHITVDYTANFMYALVYTEYLSKFSIYIYSVTLRSMTRRWKTGRSNTFRAHTSINAVQFTEVICCSTLCMYTVCAPFN